MTNSTGRMFFYVCVDVFTGWFTRLFFAVTTVVLFCLISSRSSPQEHKWCTVHFTLRFLVGRALQAAWNQGFLGKHALSKSRGLNAFHWLPHSRTDVWNVYNYTFWVGNIICVIDVPVFNLTPCFLCLPRTCLWICCQRQALLTKCSPFNWPFIACPLPHLYQTGWCVQPEAHPSDGMCYQRQRSLFLEDSATISTLPAELLYPSPVLLYIPSFLYEGVSHPQTLQNNRVWTLLFNVWALGTVLWAHFAVAQPAVGTGFIAEQIPHGFFIQLPAAPAPRCGSSWTSCSPKRNLPSLPQISKVLVHRKQPLIPQCLLFFSYFLPACWGEFLPFHWAPQGGTGSRLGS